MASEPTQLLANLRGGDFLAANRLFPLVLKELHQQAARLLERERAGHSFQPTDLVNEAYLRLIKQEGVTWQDKAHFLAVAALAMRQILVDRAKRRNRARREGSHGRVMLDSALLVVYERSIGADVEALNAALGDLAQVSPRSAQVVDMRYFADMTLEEIACVLNRSVSTVEREWRQARAWLRDRLQQREHADRAKTRSRGRR
jgi:RNA polymerase sigma factor (TIGR02999 family)